MVFLLPLLLLSVLLPVRGWECPDDWVSFHGSCYVYINDIATWTGAQKICGLMQSRLVEVESPEENAFLVSQLAIRHAPKSWLGFNDFVKEGKYVWTSTNEPMEYTHWAPGEPNNHNMAGGDQDCGVLYASGYWDDDVCENVQSHMHSFFCERAIIEAGPIG